MIEIFIVLVVLFLIAAISLILNLRNSMDEKLNLLSLELKEIHKRLEEGNKISGSKPALHPLPDLSPEIKKPETEIKAVSEISEEPIVEAIKEPIKESPPLPLEIPSVPVLDFHQEIFGESQVKPEEDKTGFPLSPMDNNRNGSPLLRKKTFQERNPDLEKFIGENLVNKIGIAILVLAIGFFVKYAIDNQWIGPVGRVSIGFLLGGILIGIAHRLRKQFHAFSSVLSGGGLAVLYFTITLAFSQFHLFSQSISFILMILVTCFSVALSLLYDREELGIIALIGGLASPFLVSGNEANYSALFLYLVILNLGLLVIAYYKLWRVLNASTFVLTILVFGWLINLVPVSSYKIIFFYSSLLYLLFFAINIAFNIRENRKFISFDFSILLLNSALYYGTGLYFLNVLKLEDYRGLFTILLAVLNLIFSFILYKNRKVDTNILYLLIGITLTYISLTAPIQLHAHYITLFWCAESVLLYQLYLRSKIKILKLGSLIIWAIMLISLFKVSSEVYSDSRHPIPILLNKGFITLLFASLANYLLYRSAKKDSQIQLYGMPFHPRLFMVISLILLFTAGFLEMSFQLHFYLPKPNVWEIYSTLYINAFIYFTVLGINRFSKEDSAGAIRLLIPLAILYTLSQYISLLDNELYFRKDQAINQVHFTAQILSMVFLGLLFYQLGKVLYQNFLTRKDGFGVWIYILTLVLILSIEFSWIFVFAFHTPSVSIEVIHRVYTKVGLPILWGISSFVLMGLGFRYKERILRIISLSLFTLTLVKLFLFDIQNIPPAGKIVAFFLLGVLLLIVSFMYQKLKNILVDEEKE